jgi:error-prone DNA polymerase
VVNAPDKGLLKHASIEEEQIVLKELTEGEAIIADYRSLGLTLGKHPVALLRSILLAKRFLPVDILNTYSDGQFARGCGMVTMRQRPGTAKGVIFVTLEDETGLVNVIVWPDLAEKQRKELLRSTLLGVYGIWQCHNNVRHLIAKRLVDLSSLLGELTTPSRDFR